MIRHGGIAEGIAKHVIKRINTQQRKQAQKHCVQDIKDSLFPVNTKILPTHMILSPLMRFARLFTENSSKMLTTDFRMLTAMAKE